MIKVRLPLFEDGSLEKARLIFNLEIYAIGMKYDKRIKKRHKKRLASAARAVRRRLRKQKNMGA